MAAARTPTAGSIEIVEAFRELGPGPQRLADIARVVGRSPSAVFKALRRITDADTDMVERIGDGYRLGSTVLALGHIAVTGATLRERVTPTLRWLQPLTDAVALAHTVCPMGTRAVIAYEAGRRRDEWLQALPSEALLADLRDLRVGAAGRAILAHLDPAEVDAALSRPDPHDVRIPTIVALRQELRDIRVQGYALSYGESPQGWGSVAASILWGSVPLGSVSVMAPTAELSDAEELFSKLVTRAAQDLSESHSPQ